MSQFQVFDFRDEFYLKTFRRLYLITTLCSNKKFSSGVSLQKAGFVDFLLDNPSVLRRFLVHFGKADPSLNLDDLLYRDDAESGGGLDMTDFSRTCALLISRGHIRFDKNEGEIILIPSGANFSVDNMMARRWEKEVSLIQPLLSKSMTVLSGGILRG